VLTTVTSAAYANNTERILRPVMFPRCLKRQISDQLCFTGRQTDRQTGRQTDRERDRQRTSVYVLDYRQL